MKNPWSFKLEEMSEEESKDLEERLKDGIPDGMFVIKEQADGTGRIYTNDRAGVIE